MILRGDRYTSETINFAPYDDLLLPQLRADDTACAGIIIETTGRGNKSPYTTVHSYQRRLPIPESSQEMKDYPWCNKTRRRSHNTSASCAMAQRYFWREGSVILCDC